MTDTRGTEQETKARQAELFRLAERDYGLTLSALATETGLSETSLKSYALSNIFARAKMPLWVFVRLCKVIPEDVTSIMVEPADKCILPLLPQDDDLDKLTAEAVEFAADKLRREADGVICHIDRKALAERARRLAVKSAAVGRAA
jgi:hypothetical protein